MIHYAAPIDLPEEPSPVAIDGDKVTLSTNILHFDNTDLWGARQISQDWPDHPEEAVIFDNFDTIWNQWLAQSMAEQSSQDEEGGTDAVLTDLYEEMLALQEAQKAQDATLCDLYEAILGGAE